MKKTPLLCAIALATAFAGHADAVYKCTTPKGVVYQDRPCREGTESDVQIVIPTGELAPKAVSPKDEGTQGNAARVDNRTGVTKPRRAGDEPASVTKHADKRGANETTSNAADENRKKDARAPGDSSVPMTAEQARKFEATAKYYTTDAAAPGAETPEHMTCESPSGEKRRFILTDGKLTSI